MRRNIKRNLGLMIVLFMTFGLIACSKGGGISDGTDLLGKVLSGVSGENAHDDNADDGEGSNFWNSGSADDADNEAAADHDADSDDWNSGSAGDSEDDADVGQSVDEFLARYGLKLSDVDPDEPYYRAMLEGSCITFFMEAGTGMSILAYLSILVLIPIFGGGTNRFTRFHANQGLVLFIIEVIFGIISQIFWWSLPYGGLWRFMNMLSGLAGLVFCVASVIGILNAVNGVKKELPLIGKIKILK